jgi:16S rRNA (guanine(966)-N(2))-methyltransferase RsmD
VRLTGGEARGRRLKGARGLPIRPTSDRVREALFDILGGRVENALFLDAYAGVGAVGIEALSRGARSVVFLERDARVVRRMRENLAMGQWSGRYEIRRGEVAELLEQFDTHAERFHIVFLDPPYDQPVSSGLLDIVARILAPAGVVVIEHATSRRAALPSIENLRKGRSYRYGDTSLTLLHAGEGEPHR